MLGGSHVQAAGRLIKYEYFRLLDECTGDGEALLMSLPSRVILPSLGW